MDQGEIKLLVKEINEALRAIDIDKLKKQHDELKTASEKPGFWDDNQQASKTMQKIAALDEKINVWQSLAIEGKELLELSELGDNSLESEIKKQFDILEKRYRRMHLQLAYSGPHDESDALLSIHAGAGGVDAQDWAAMLLRMYLRWAEKSGFKTRVLEESAGEEAGLKSVSLEIKGELAYGKLKGEHGVHRLVRLSPFNADNLRQTSFAKVEVLPEIDEPKAVPLEDKDLKVDVFRAGGHGGQSVNTTDSAVRITHLPTGITVSIQNERSQIQNKETAMTILRSKLAQLQLEQHKGDIAEIKGPNKSAEWGNQIRSYVLHPYKQVKDLRTRQETSDPQAVLDGDIDAFIDAYAAKSLTDSK
ncbi:MAG TPA: peptide chain release factor 2 [Candidatus Saccharimonadales bacterium]|nr:peptide chain release factor 2 [Candidatus Saccharimonadales bacterium]